MASIAELSERNHKASSECPFPWFIFLNSVGKLGISLEISGEPVFYDCIKSRFLLSQWSCGKDFTLLIIVRTSLWFAFYTVGFSVVLVLWEAELLILFAVLWTSSYIFSKPKSPGLLPCSVGRPLSIFVAPYVCCCLVCGIKQWQIPAVFSI